MANFAGKKILLVEDDNFLSELLSKKLIDSQATVTRAANGEEAISIVKSNPKFDLILLDLMLPKIGGFEVMEAINADEKIKGTPIIILSNLGQKNDVEKGVSLGAKKFLVKAILSLDEIVDAAAEIIK
ncbi:MAG: response regulator [Candidatus Paceibacterota bacterium]|jgi:CheY-like chemotaxis protein